VSEHRHEPITSEPVRGVLADERHFGLSGLEHVRAMARGLIAEPPLLRLTGIRVTSASAGRVTVTQPASPWLQSGSRRIFPHPLLEYALRMAVLSGAPARTLPLQNLITANYIRGPSIEAEGFVARAQLISAGRSRCVAICDIEDAFGRLVTHGVGEFVLEARDVDPPSVIERAPEAIYPTPDPSARPLDASVATWSLDVFTERVRKVVSGELPPSPVARLLGMRAVEAEDGRSTYAVKASEWIANTRVGIFPGVMGLAMLSAAGTAGQSLVAPPGLCPSQSLHYSYFKPVPPDGRELIARARVIHHEQHQPVVVIAIEVTNADGERVALGTSYNSITEGASVGDEIGPDRVLTTLLFTDVVSSTERAAALGDAKWTSELEAHLTLVRRQLQIFGGREVKTVGDGFLATFDSPARAVQCARAIAQTAEHSHLPIRAGVHLGECEVMGADIAGIAVHVARRVCDVGGSGDVMVTSTVREASSGSGLRFADRGMHQLKGVPDEWRLFAVES
jgi:class 3 adenylate cyclase